MITVSPPASRGGRAPLGEIRNRIRGQVVGRERELDLVLAAVAAGRDVLLEGPPGTSKSTLLRAITREWGIPLVFVEGNADLTPAKLIGHHNPARVLREDYSPENFVDGPLLEAMRSGGFLYMEEFNRAPEDTLNTLLTAMAERRIAVPRVGEVIAGDTFRVIASMNPYDNIGTTRLSTSVHDRLCRLAVSYQDAAAERGIVALRAPLSDPVWADPVWADPVWSGLAPGLYARLVADAVAVTRATREHQDLRQGSSVRGAIDLTLVAGQLFTLDPERVRVSALSADDPARAVDGVTGDAVTEGVILGEAAEAAYRETVYDAMVLALSGRIFLDETVDATAEQVLRQIWEDHFILRPAAAAPG
jgi:MoxR-like ATPase